MLLTPEPLELMLSSCFADGHSSTFRSHAGSPSGPTPALRPGSLVGQWP